jgi:hypothetical protein
MSRRWLLFYAAVCLLTGLPTSTHAYPGLGKLPLAPVPYAVPAPQYPSHIQLSPTRPNPQVIPSVIFRPPSEVLRNFGELKAEASALESSLYREAETYPAQDEQPFVSDRAPAARKASHGGMQDQTDPLLRPTRRQALGW